MKRIAPLLAMLLFGFVCACKTTDSAPQPQPADPTPAPTAVPRARQAPSLAAPTSLGSDTPALPEEGSDRRHDRMARMDTDGDGKVSDEEREAAMKQRTAKMRERLDTNNDGKLTVDEMKNARGRMKFDDPAALDTNNDGDISTDELEAGMKARRDEMRAKRMNGRTPPVPATGQ